MNTDTTNAPSLSRPLAPLLVALSIMLGSAGAANAQVSVDFGFPGLNIGINMPAYPQLVLVPGSPVYYAPRASFNFFFFDGLYWVYRDDNWYSSNWYNGPWRSVGPEYVPLFILRVPVRYYRQPPDYFRGWRADAPPRWGQHWGRDWESRRSGWNEWDRRSVPAPAPLPTYQRQYRGETYPRAVEQQRSIRDDHYRYQPRDAVVREQYHGPATQAPPPSREQQRGSMENQAPAPRPREESQYQPGRQEAARQEAPQPHTREAAPPMQRQEAVPDNRGHYNPRNEGGGKENKGNEGHGNESHGEGGHR